ncbi:acyl-CoA--6-aminopenicillanic acid acyltransferase [Salicibibacter cibarius]|uniref:Acyl-CoA--6-aminopenicillanic acid acyltransferase n=1 Tax=Salicibibacter cibarius TaxID=2743000 RepID=A0A7T7CAI1_9BACI|nr:C45 family peptidase [Salicibibacter cibarius]QQK74924.1 acyl-CoA--6-aminopenicillanic acid acyltransferase [Salicibibacter cibarius]
MKQIYSDILQFRGNHYTFGYDQGEKLKNSLSVKNRENQWKVRTPRFNINIGEAKEAIRAFAPGVWDELLGLQDALEWPLERVLQEYGGYRVNSSPSGCSVLAGKSYLIRNYDYHPKTYDGRFLFFQPTDQGYAIAGPSQRITGRMDGINEKGLVMAYNLTNRKKPGAGFICSMIGRLLLESCADVTEAVEMAKEIPHRHSFSYLVYDPKGEMMVVEASPRGVNARQATACTNHFDIQTGENRFHLDDSKQRLDTLNNANLNARDAFRLLNDTNQPIFSERYKSWAGTIHTSVYFPKERKIWITLGGDREPAVFDFASWLEGEDVTPDRLTGEVDTDLPFLHMDEGADWFRKK